jgi:GNAT superfamily N-acetyltransferase
VLDRALDHSLCLGAYRDGAQVGFARAVTDQATFAYLADVFVLPQARGQGCAQQMVEALLARPELQGLRRMALATRDAHALYARHGFTPLARPETFMERYRPDLYAPPPTTG